MFLCRLDFNRLRRLCFAIFLRRHFLSEPIDTISRVARLRLRQAITDLI